MEMLDVNGPAAPPRDNGTLIFAAPWESRAFGVVMALHADGLFQWEDFRQCLIRAIAAWEGAPEPKAPWSYYACWLAALENLLSERGLVGRGEIDLETQHLAARAHGHDHR